MVEKPAAERELEKDKRRRDWARTNKAEMLGVWEEERQHWHKAVKKRDEAVKSKDKEDLRDAEKDLADVEKDLKSAEKDFHESEKVLDDADKELAVAEDLLKTVTEARDHAGWVVIVTLLLLTLAAVLASAAGLVCEYLAAGVFARMVKDIRQRMFDHLQTLSMPFFTRTRAGTILSRFSGDTVALDEALSLLVTSFLLPFCEVVGATVVMFYFNVWLALLGSLLFPWVLFGSRIFAIRAFVASHDKRQHKGEILSAVQENVAAQPVVKAFGLEQQAGSIRERDSPVAPVAFRVNFLSALVERGPTSAPLSFIFSCSPWGPTGSSRSSCRWAPLWCSKGCFSRWAPPSFT